MGLYDFIIKDKNGSTLANLTGAKDRWWVKELNAPGEAGFSISASDPNISADILRPGQKELYIYRRGVLIWGGEIQTRRSDIGTEGDGTITVTAKGFLELLSKKLVGTIASPETYTGKDLSDIAEDLRAASQTGTDADLGITSGALAVSRDADRTYKFETVKDALIGLTNSRVQNGIDINVAPDKQLSTFYPSKGRDLEDVVFEYGVNITSYFYIDDATELANQIIVIGEDDGPSTPVVTRDAPAYLQDETTGYGIRQDKISRSNVTETSTLEEWGDRELAKRQQGKQIVGINVKGNLNPAPESYDVGDRARVRIKHGIDDVDALTRINTISCRITDNDEEDINIQFGEGDDYGTSFDDLEERVENLETAA